MNLTAKKKGGEWIRNNCISFSDGFHAATVNKLKKNERINTDTINSLCKLLECQPGDILEYVPDVPDDSEIKE